MKKLLFIGILLLSLNVFTQNFPGVDVQLLVGKEIKVIEKAEILKKYGYDDFFEDVKLKKKYACCESYNSKYDALSNKVFKVLGFEPYVNIIGTKKFKLEIENSEIGIIYFDYSSEFKHSFPFEVVGGLDFPEGYFCKDIDEKVDKFTNEITLRSPLLNPISFTKVKKNNSAITYMRISVNGSTVTVNKKGVIILFDDGTKLERPNEDIDVKVSNSGGGFVYTAFLSLSENEIEKLSQKRITDVRLYIYDREIDEGVKIKEYIRCIKKS